MKVSQKEQATVRRVLFLPFYESQLREFLPIIKRMQAQKTPEPLVITVNRFHTTVLETQSEQLQIPFLKMDFFPGKYLEGRQITTRDMVRLVHHPLRHISTLFHTRKQIRKLLETMQPALVVTTNEAYYIERFLLEEAKRRQIPSLCLFSVRPLDTASAPHTKAPLLSKLLSRLLNLDKTLMTALGFPLRNVVPAGGRATQVTVWNETTKNLLVKEGGLPERIAVTGSPAHDIIYSGDYWEFLSADEIADLLKISRQQPIILFLTEPFSTDKICTAEEQRRLTELVIESALQNTDALLVLKLHPRETPAEYDYLKDNPLRNRFRVVSSAELDLYSILRVCRLVLIQSSSAGADAVLFDKDMVNINVVFKSQPDYVKAGTTLNVTSANELAAATQQALNDATTQADLKRARKAYIKENFPAFDGKATDRVTALMGQLIKKG